MTRLREIPTVIFMNGTSSGYSGGDLHVMAVAREWSRSTEIIVEAGHAFSPALAPFLEGSWSKVHGRMARRGDRSRAALLLVYAVRSVMAFLKYLFVRPNGWVSIASSHYPYDVIPALAAGGRRGTVVYWHHHVPNLRTRGRALHWILQVWERVAIRLLLSVGLTAFITSCEDTKTWLVSMGVPESQIHKTNNGTSMMTVVREQSPPPEAGGPGVRRVLVIGRLSAAKGVEDLYDIVPRVLEQVPQAEFTFIGQGTEEGKELIRELVRRGFGGRITQLGFVTECRKARLLDEAHVVLSASREEGWGIALTEAVLSGAWVVAYDLPGFSPIVRQQALLVTTGSTRRFVEQVVCVLGLDRPSRPQIENLPAWPEIAEEELTFIRETLCSQS